MDKNSKDYLLSEYSSLRQEVLDTLKEVTTNEKAVLLFSGAYWAWTLTNLNNIKYLDIVAWVPVVLSLLFTLRAFSLDKKFDTFHKYILNLESQFNLEGLGWEHHIGNKKRGWFTLYNRLFWGILFLGNFIAGVLIVNSFQSV